MSFLFLGVFVLEFIWWIAWMFIAYSKKIYANFYFMLASVGVWGTLATLTVLGSSNEGGEFLFVFAFFLAVVPFLLLPGMVSIITEYQRGVLFRLGKMVGILEPGLNVIFPFGIDKVWKVDLRTFTIDMLKQEVITKDNVPVFVDAVVYFNVFQAGLAVTKVANYTQSTSLFGQTTLRSVLGQHDLDEILSKRSELNQIITKILDEATEGWGIKITAVEIKSIELPDSMKRAMAKQAEAERERRAKVIAADGEYQASEKLLEAATVLAKEPSTLQLRYLQTLTEIAVEKNSTILFPIPIDLVKSFIDKK